MELLRKKLAYLTQKVRSAPESDALSGHTAEVESVHSIIRNDPQLIYEPSILSQFLVLLRTSAYGCNLSKKASINKSKESPLAVSTCKVLLANFATVQDWPVDFLELYVDDSLGTRQWVDAIDAQPFCKRIVVSAMGTSQTGTASLDCTSQYKFQHCRTQAVETLMCHLVSRCGQGLPQMFFARHGFPDYTVVSSGMSQNFNSSATAVIATIGKFCGLPQVRLLAASNIERWLQNPAVVEHVRSLLARVIGSLGKGYSILVHAPQASSQSADIAVIEDFVKLRSKIKPSFFDAYKGILIDAATKHDSSVASHILRTIITDDISSGMLKPETSKLLTSVILAIAFPARQSVESHQDPSMKRSHAMLCQMLGEIVFTIICSQCNPSHLKSCSSGYSLLTGGIQFQRILITVIIKCIRAIGVPDFDFASFIAAALASPQRFPSALLSHVALETGDSELVYFYLDIVVSIQLLIGSDLVLLERDLNNLGASGNITSSGSRVTSSGASLGVHGLPVGRGGASTGHGPGLGGGRGLTRSLPEGIPSFLMSSSANRGLSKPIGQSSTSSSRASDRLSSTAAGVSSLGNSGGPPTKKALQENRVRLLKQLLGVQEMVAAWILSLRTAILDQDANDGDNSRIVVTDTNRWLGFVSKALCLDASSVNSAGAAIVASKIEFETSSAFAIRDQGLCSDSLIAHMVDITSLSSHSVDQVMAGTVIIELVLQRALKTCLEATSATFSSSSQSAKLSTDSNVVDPSSLICKIGTVSKLYSLASIHICSTKQPRRSRRLTELPLDVFACELPPTRSSDAMAYDNCRLSMIDANKRTNCLPLLFPNPFCVEQKLETSQAYLPHLADQSILSKIDFLCFLLGFFSLSVVGNFLWDHVPAVHNLMKLTISERYHEEDSVAAVLVSKDLLPQLSSPFIDYLKSDKSTYKNKSITVSKLPRVVSDASYLAMCDMDAATSLNTCPAGGRTSMLLDSVLVISPTSIESPNDPAGGDARCIQNKIKFERVLVEYISRYFNDMSEREPSDVSITSDTEEVESSTELGKRNPRSVGELEYETEDDHSDEENSLERKRIRISYSEDAMGDHDDRSCDARMMLPAVDAIRKLQLPTSFPSSTCHPHGTLQSQYGHLPNERIVLMKRSSGVASVRLQKESRCTLKAISEKYSLGKRLRNSTEPDFIARVLMTPSPTAATETLETVDNIDWLVPAMMSESASERNSNIILNRLPVTSLVQLSLSLIHRVFRHLQAFDIWERVPSCPITRSITACRESVSSESSGYHNKTSEDNQAQFRVFPFQATVSEWAVNRVEVTMSSICTIQSSQHLLQMLLASEIHQNTMKLLVEMISRFSSIILSTNDDADCAARVDIDPTIALLLRELSCKRFSQRSCSRLFLEFIKSYVLENSVISSMASILNFVAPVFALGPHLASDGGLDLLLANYSDEHKWPRLHKFVYSLRGHI